MIRVMTLDAGAAARQTKENLREAMEGVQRADIDLLCCQSVGGSGKNGEDARRMLAEASGLTCTCFVPGGMGPDGNGSAPGGLAILTGAGIWTLNSGSLALAGEPGETERIAQFALVRKGMVSVLALNLHLAATASGQAVQLRALFGHSLLKDSYGAVVVCADHQPALGGGEIEAMVSRAGYAPHGSLIATTAGSTEGFLCLLAARNQGQFELTMDDQNLSWPGKSQTRTMLPGLAISFALSRTGQDRKRPFLPLSFREQWLGCRDHYRAFVA